MLYIHDIATVSHQDSFGKELDFRQLQPLHTESELVKPNFKEYIPASALRRLSPILRMGLTCAKACSTDKDFDAISIGTGLGCLKDTEKFLQTYINAKSDFLSPTAFIQSTHNTIGGQISLGLKSHAYNMTHTQNEVSFECALVDAELCASDGSNNVLVGCADEAIPFLEEINSEVIKTDLPFTSSASFFRISGENSGNLVGIKSVKIQNNSEINIDFSQYDFVFHTGQISIENGVNYMPLVGYNHASSAFATHLAHDYLKTINNGTVLVLNALGNNKIGLIELTK